MKKYIGILSIIAAIALVAFLMIMHEEPEKESKAEELMEAHIVSVKPQTVTDIITGHGQVKARWETTLSSEVSGRILSVSDKFLSGAEFNKGDVLAVVDDTNYLAALAEAKSRLATAKRTLKEEEQRSKIAQENWETSGFLGKPTDLVLRKPQLAEARAAIESAKAAIKKAEYDLKQTKITAPYDGVVISRNINPGNLLQMGTVIGSIYDRSLYEITVPLSVHAVARLPKQESEAKHKVIIRSQKSDKIWEGSVSRIEQVIDQKNRWQNVIIEMSNSKELLPGEFVTVEFTGQIYDNILAFPENIPGSDGYVWYVDAQNHLQRFTPDILFKRDGQIFIKAPTEKEFTANLTIAKDIYLPDIKVNPIMPTSISSLEKGGSDGK